MPETKGVLTQQAETAWKLILLVVAIGGAGFAAANYMNGHSAQPASIPQHNLLPHIEKLEQQSQQLMVDMAILKTQITDMRMSYRQMTSQTVQQPERITEVKKKINVPVEIIADAAQKSTHVAR
jgi:hypothetical protein